VFVGAASRCLGGTNLDVAAVKSRNPPSLSLLIALTAAGPLALNIFIPSMPGMVTTLGTDYATVQLTLTLYLAAMGGYR